MNEKSSLLDEAERFEKENPDLFASSFLVPFAIKTEKEPESEDPFSVIGVKVGKNTYLITAHDFKTAAKAKTSENPYGKISFSEPEGAKPNYDFFGNAVLTIYSGRSPEESLEIMKYVSNFIRKECKHGMTSKKDGNGVFYATVSGVNSLIGEKLFSMKNVNEISFFENKLSVAA